MVAIEIEMIAIEETGRDITCMKLIFLSLYIKKNILQIFIAVELKKQNRENTLEAHGEISKAELLGNNSSERKGQGHQYVTSAL